MRHLILAALLTGCATQEIKDNEYLPFNDDGGQTINTDTLLVTWCELPLVLLIGDEIYLGDALVQRIMKPHGGGHNRIELETIYPKLMPCGQSI